MAVSPLPSSQPSPSPPTALRPPLSSPLSPSPSPPPSTSPVEAERRLDALRKLLGKSPGDPLKIVGVGAGAWGSVFIAMLQDSYGSFPSKAVVRIWRRSGRALSQEVASGLVGSVTNNEALLRRLMRDCGFMKYAEARLGERVLYADEVLRDGFCVNMLDTPLPPLHVVTNLQEAVWDADLVINALPSTETRSVFSEIGRFWKERRRDPAVVVSLSKGVEAVLEPKPHIVTPTLMIHQSTGIPLENILYLGGPNIASEIYRREYANARLCGPDRWRQALAEFFRQPHFVVWDNSDLATHELMGGLKNVYAIGAGLVASLTSESATSKAVYFAYATSEMLFAARLFCATLHPEELAGPLLADTYVTLLKGRNSWYGRQLAEGGITPEMGDNVPGKGIIQGVSAVAAFHALLGQAPANIPHPVTGTLVTPLELCPILKTLHAILHTRESEPIGILHTLRDENTYDPRLRLSLSLHNSSLGHLLEPPV